MLVLSVVSHGPRPRLGFLGHSEVRVPSKEVSLFSKCLRVTPTFSVMRAGPISEPETPGYARGRWSARRRAASAAS